MKQNFTRFVAASLLLFLSLPGISQVAENFNTRPGALNGTDIQNLLISKGWTFSSTTISTTTVIEGDGSAQTKVLNTALGNPIDNAGIYTPELTVTGNTLTVGFSYRYEGSSNGFYRSFRIYLTDCNNNPVGSQLVEIISSNTTTSIYNQTFAVAPGNYKVHINFIGLGGNSRAIIDAINIEGADLKYANGVNSAPVGNTDLVNGLGNFTASGNVLTNDVEPDNESKTANLFEAPPAAHGTVTLNANGTFNFTPAPGFTGSSTSFKYTVCDNACQPLCSDPVTVLISFPVGAPMPVMMLDFTATKQSNNVLLNWSTSSEVNNARFEVERSTNGTSFTKIGEVTGRGTVSSITDYNYTDQLGAISASHIFYRLRQVDIDGKFEYTKTVVVRTDASANANIVTVSPNPFVSQVRLNINLDRPSSVSVRILDNSSRELLRKNMKGYSGSNSFTIEEVSKLNKGIYIVEILIDNQQRIVSKLIKH